ncbi:hypothetical protein [Candidatus Williamhamiltonella defendens]|uniref:Uncharacterized protein n=2 Tax=Candidatus Williamhamiltonella defendens TaxID=138072 RepID=A0A249DZJ9_9ENTR|nr:hypothetical protein [Candidatus Hamiltonella defensa]ASX26851.1 hypothetical protein BA171_07555 [Candidatus Hamiltonella defensa (Bemisia tabaci)]CED78144.1 Protein of unknown function [Candidatus Hamiltonella defensa (Bemisia tabaci)]
MITTVTSNNITRCSSERTEPKKSFFSRCFTSIKNRFISLCSKKDAQPVKKDSTEYIHMLFDNAVEEGRVPGINKLPDDFVNDAQKHSQNIKNIVQGCNISDQKNVSLAVSQLFLDKRITKQDEQEQNNYQSMLQYVQANMKELNENTKAGMPLTKLSLDFVIACKQQKIKDKNIQSVWALFKEEPPKPEEELGNHIKNLNIVVEACQKIDISNIKTLSTIFQLCKKQKVNLKSNEKLLLTKEEVIEVIFNPSNPKKLGNIIKHKFSEETLNEVIKYGTEMATKGTETNQKEFSKKADEDSLNELSCSLGLSKQSIKDYPRLTVIVAGEKIFSENEGDKQLKECATQFQTHTLLINSSFNFPGFMSCFTNQSIFPLGLRETQAKGKQVLNQDCFFNSGASFFEIKKMDENNNSTIATIKARCTGSIRISENPAEAGLPVEITFKLDVIENESKFQINQQTAQGECVFIDLK